MSIVTQYVSSECEIAVMSEWQTDYNDDDDIEDDSHLTKYVTDMQWSRC